MPDTLCAPPCAHGILEHRDSAGQLTSCQVLGCLCKWWGINGLIVNYVPGVALYTDKPTVSVAKDVELVQLEALRDMVKRSDRTVYIGKDMLSQMIEELWRKREDMSKLRERIAELEKVK